jgi:serine/threonine protein kinase/tetratricopeptide (TPR) repeat protein
MSTQSGEETLLVQAVRLTGDERAEFLEQKTRGNPALRERIESLLNSYEAGDFLEEAADPAVQQTALAPPAGEKPGDWIGRYKLLEQIGEGGCGVVYVAAQQEPVKRRVALKIIKLGMDTKSVVARFEAERQALALMDHPNIAKVLDAGATDSGRPYFVMELVRGMKITNYCDEAKLPIRGRLNLFVQVCHAIQHAHQKGIIHRDIKPSNVLVTVNDGVAVPKVIDFGIAKATNGQRLTDQTIYTAFEQFIGTPAYMSPEQAVLTSLDIDTRSDIYALGVLLYEMLTGETPFDSKELLAIGLDEMRRTIREREPQRPSTRLSTMAREELSTTAQRRGIAAPRLATELRGDLDWIVMKALEKDRARRYETASELALDVLRHVENQPVVACPPSRLYRLRKFVERNKLAVVVGSTIALLLATGAVFCAALYANELSAKKTAQEEAAASRQIEQFLSDMLKGVGPSVAMGRDTTMLRDILDKTGRKLENELTGQPKVRAELCAILGEVYNDLGDFKSADRLLRQGLAQSGTNNLIAAKLLYELANSLFNQGDSVPQAETLLRQSLAIRRTLLGENNLDVAATLCLLAQMQHAADGRLAEAESRLAEAESLTEQAVAITRRFPGHEREQASALDGLAYAELDLGKLAKASDSDREAMSLMTRNGETNDPLFLKIEQNLGVGLMNQGKFQEAESPLRASLEQKRKIYSPGNPRLANNIHALAVTLRNVGRLSEAESLEREALSIREKTFPAGNSLILNSQVQLAVILFQEGKMEEAETLARTVLDELRQKPVNAVQKNIVAWFLSTFQIPAVRDGKLAVELAENAVAQTNRKDAGILDTLAAAYAETGQFDKAVAAEKEAIPLAENELSKEEFGRRLALYTAHKPYRSDANKSEY